MPKRLTPATIMASAVIGVMAGALVIAAGAFVRTALIPASGGAVALAAIGPDSMGGLGFTGLPTSWPSGGAGDLDADCFVCLSTSEGFVFDDEEVDPEPTEEEVDSDPTEPPVDIVDAPEPPSDEPDDVDVAPIEEPDASGEEADEETNPDETGREQDPDPDTGAEPEPTTPEPIADPEPEPDDGANVDPKDDEPKEDKPKKDKPKDDPSDEDSNRACQLVPVDLPPAVCPDGDTLGGVDLPLLDF